MANAKVKLYYTTSEYLQTLPIKNGNIIFVPDNDLICLDISNQRFTYQTIKTFSTEQEREQTPFPNEGFYYVEATNVIWRWANNQWSKITPTNLTPVVYGATEQDFPAIGKNDTLYYTDEGIYNYKSQNNKYNLIANANTWDGI